MRLCWVAVPIAGLALAVAVQSALSARVQKASDHFRLTPIDEAHLEPRFVAFRDQLLTAVRKRDSQMLLDSSAEQPRKQFAPGLEPGASTWAELEKVLLLGGSFTVVRGSVAGRREFCAPYTYSAYPTRGELNDILPRLAGHDDNPEGDPWVILGERVRIRAAPSSDARVLGSWTHSLVLTAGGEAPASPPVKWREVYMDTGRTGWVNASLIRSPLDYRACFANLNGVWKITLFDRG